MQNSRYGASIRNLLFSILALVLPNMSVAEPFYEGPKVCQECHESEYQVWQDSNHFKAYKDVHKRDKADEILAAVGEKSMKKSEVCSSCHYTVVQKEAGGKAKPKAGPSCESCHGPSSDWRAVHNDFGGESVKAEDETAEHKTQRINDAKSKGMIWSFMHYDIAANCMDCHGLARDGVDSDTMAKMLDAGHPANEGFEVVKYSQGQVRHRFYPPDITKNAEMSKAELSRLFVVGQAAQLVAATKALAGGGGEAYKAFQTKRVDSAKAALGNVSSVAEVTALISAPTEDNARKVATAVKDKDLSAEVGSLLPSDYK